MINFPPGCEVYDEVNGLGWIKQGADTPTPAPTPLRAAKKKSAMNPWWIALATANAALIATIAWLAWRRGRLGST